MGFTLPQGTFPPLALSERRRRALLDEATRVVGEALAANEAFIADGRVLRASQWKLVRAKEAVRVYQQRADASRSGAAVHSSSSSSAETRDLSAADPARATVVEAMKRPHVPLLALHGVVEGTLEDTMYGVFADDDRSWRWRSAHVRDRFDDAKLLATLARPDARDPFRFAGVKWFAKEHPAVLSSFVQRRDFVIVEASGVATDAQGRRVGYMLMHSVVLRAVPELSQLGVVRGRLSFCYLVRQRSDARSVEIFGRGFSDPQGDMMERVSVAIAAEALIAAVSVVDYAYVKKLAHFAQLHSQQQQAARRGDAATGDTSTSAPPANCESCTARLGSDSGSGSEGGGGGGGGRLGELLAAVMTGAAAHCSICRRRVCAKCSVLKKMTVDVAPPRTAVQRSLRFCVACVLRAKDASAWDIAVRALAKSSSPSSSSAASASPASAPTAFEPATASLSTPSRVARAYAQQAPPARFPHKTRFPTASGARGGGRSKLVSVAPTVQTPPAPAPTPRRARNSQKLYDVLGDAVGAPANAPAPRRPPPSAPGAVTERRVVL